MDSILPFRRGRGLLPLVVVFLAFGASLAAQEGKTLTPAEVKWPGNAVGGVGTSLASGIQTAVLFGDPAKPGLYTIRLRIGPNMTIQVHSHADNRVATVVS